MSDYVFEGKLIKVRVTDGKEIVEHPGSVSVVPIDRDGNLVLVRQHRPAVNQDVLEIPAGTRDVQGEPPEETARRELEEECGMTADRIEHVGSLFPSPGYTSERQEVYIATGLSGDGEVVRVPFKEVATLAAEGDLADMKTVAAVLLALHRIATPG
jgi:ADP-ribose pyrophosphatase